MNPEAFETRDLASAERLARRTAALLGEPIAILRHQGRYYVTAVGETTAEVVSWIYP